MPDKYGDIIILMTIIRRLGYIFENLAGRFYQNGDAGQFYAGRDIIKLLASILISEGCDEAVTCLIQGFLPVFVSAFEITYTAFLTPRGVRRAYFFACRQPGYLLLGGEGCEVVSVLYTQITKRPIP